MIGSLFKLAAKRGLRGAAVREARTLATRGARGAVVRGAREAAVHEARGAGVMAHVDRALNVANILGIGGEVLGEVADTASLVEMILAPELIPFAIGAKLLEDHFDKKSSQEEQKEEAQATLSSIQQIKAEKNQRQAQRDAAQLRETNRQELEQAQSQRGQSKDHGVMDAVYNGINNTFGTPVFETTSMKGERRTNEAIERLESDKTTIEKSLSTQLAAFDAEEAKEPKDSDSDEDEAANQPERKSHRSHSRDKSDAHEKHARSGQGAARLINARSGAKDIAQAAALAGSAARHSSGCGGGGPDPGMRNGLEAIHNTMKQQHSEALGQNSRAQFTQRWARR